MLLRESTKPCGGRAHAPPLSIVSRSLCICSTIYSTPLLARLLVLLIYYSSPWSVSFSVSSSCVVSVLLSFSLPLSLFRAIAFVGCWWCFSMLNMAKHGLGLGVGVCWCGRVVYSVGCPAVDPYLICSLLRLLRLLRRVVSSSLVGLLVCCTVQTNNPM